MPMVFRITAKYLFVSEVVNIVKTVFEISVLEGFNLKLYKYLNSRPDGNVLTADD